MEDLLRRSLFDGDLGPGREADVDRARRRGDVEWDPVLLCDDSLRVRAALVRGVSVRRDPVRPHEDEVDLAAPQQVALGAAPDDRVPDPSLPALPRAQPGPLQSGPGFNHPAGATA